MDKQNFVINSKNSNIPELLLDAVENGNQDIVKDLLKHADVNMLFKYYDDTPLHIAAKHKHEEIAKLLISYGANINAYDKNGKTPIFYAIENADIKMTKLLLSSGANVKCDPEQLNIAVERGCIEIVNELLQHEVAVTAQDGIGRTALHFTTFSKTYECRDVNIKVKIAKLLLTKGADVDAKTKNGVTTLNYAILRGYDRIVETLLEHNANVNSRQKNGMTPLHFSVRSDNEVITKMLLNKGANVNAKTKDDTTAIHIAIERGQKSIVELLLEYGADVDLKMKRGLSPLHLCVETGDLEIIETLLKFGADVNSRNKKGTSALQIASMRGHEDAVQTLLEYGADMTDLGLFYWQRRYTNPRVYGCELASEVFIRHITKMEVANLYANEKDTPTIVSGKIVGFDVECENELVRMRKEKIGDTNISFYDIMAKDTNTLSKCLRNEYIEQALKTDEYRTKYPIYAGLIKSHFRMGMTRKKLHEQANNICHIILPQLPYDCTEKLFSYLSDKDLRNLKDTCESEKIAIVELQKKKI